MSAQKRSIESQVSEWVLKIALIFYVFSFLFSDLGLANPEGKGFAGIDLMSWMIVLIFGAFLFTIEKSFFKIVFFSVSILVALFKSLMFLSKDLILISDFMALSDEILIIAASFYFMSRYFKQQRRKTDNQPKPLFKSFFGRSKEDRKTKHHTHRKFNQQLNEAEEINKLNEE